MSYDGWLAQHYDDLFHHAAAFRRAHRQLAGPLLRTARSACDLGCGTGIRAVELAGRGLQVFAVDASASMCRLARQRARAAGRKVTVGHADMRRFVLPQPVDLVLSECDALNHLPRRTDLALVVKQVARALTPGGHFLFDVNNRRAFERIWSHTWFLEAPGVALTMRGEHEPGTDSACMHLEWFVRAGALWKRRRQRVEEVCWSAGEIRTALRDAGFTGIRQWDAAPFFDDGFTGPGQRTFWLARLR